MDRGNIIFMVFSGTVFTILVIVFVCSLVMNFFRQKQRLLLELQSVESKYRQGVANEQYEMLEHVFRTIGQEIHDNVGQTLTLAKINLNILSMETAAAPRMLEVGKQISQAIDELRHLSNSYNSDSLLDTGLITALQLQFQQLQKTGLFRVSYQSEIEEVKLSTIQTIFLYRMVQEVLSNAVQHSGANELSGRVFCKEPNLHIIIHDNGRGFNETGAGFKSGMGLQDIRQRAAMIDAGISIHNQTGEGTTVHFVCKYNGYD